MAIFMGLSGVAGVVSLGCWVMVLIELFEREGTGKGILGIVCGIYTFFWGWQNVGALERQPGGAKYRTIMLVWMIALAASIVFQILSRTILTLLTGDF